MAQPRIVSEDVISIGNGRHARFRRDRRFHQVQVVFTAPKGINPNPGRELTDQFKEQGWRWRPNQPGRPWIYQLDKPSEDDPTARGDSRDVLHEQFVLIIEEYRQKRKLPPLSDWRSLAATDNARNADQRWLSGGAVDDHAPTTAEEPKPQSAERETRAGRPEGAAALAAAMLDAFASVGAERFDLTFTDAAGDKVGFRGNRSLGELRFAMPAILQAAEERQHNVILRPRSAGTTLIQLDDLAEAAAEQLRPVSFLQLCTSPGSYQAWIAVTDADADFARQLRKGAGADLTASGATRVSGSVNFKDKYAPVFPRVKTVYSCPGKIVTPAELEALGIVAPEEKTAAAPIPATRSCPAGRGWPSYQRCLEHAPAARDGGRPDISRADFTFCLLALDWGWSVEDTVARLMQESDKAQAEGEKYALRTAEAAAKAIAWRGGRKR